MVQNKAAVLGWEFMPSFPTPNGDYHLLAYAKEGARHP